MITSNKNFKYLCFEGSGGYIFSHIGGLMGLNDPEVKAVVDYFTEEGKVNKDRIQGISGTAETSIIAAMLACGASVENIYDRLVSGDLIFSSLREFYGREKQYRYIHSLGGNSGYIREPRILEEIKNISISDYYKSNDLVEGMVVSITDWLIQEGVERFSRSISEHLPTLIRAEDLVRDIGFYSGIMLRENLDNILGQALPRLQEDNYIMSEYTDGYILESLYGFGNVTFERQYSLNKIELIIIGTDFKNGRALYFSRHTTPHLPIADAVLASMAIPLYIKPLVADIKRDPLVNVDEKGNLIQVIFDRLSVKERELLKQKVFAGCLINNYPAKAFSFLNKPTGTSTDALTAMEEAEKGLIPEGVWGFRTLKPYYLETKNFQDFFTNTLFTLLLESTSSQFTSDKEREKRSFLLNTDALELTNYEVGDRRNAIDKQIQVCREQVKSYLLGR